MTAPAFSDEALQRAAEHFAANFAERGEIGAEVSIWRGGREILHLAHGLAHREQNTPWTDATLVPVWSASKGVAAVACLLALMENGLQLEDPVSHVWPGLAEMTDKESLTFGHILSHRAGLAALDEVVSVLDHEGVIDALERQVPSHAPGSAQTYHPRTFGFLLDEIVRRVTGAASLGAYFEERLRRRQDLRFWLGLPETEHANVARLYPGRFTPGAEHDPFLQALQTPDTLTQRAFQSPKGLNAVADMNQPSSWKLGLAAMGGVGSARALAQFYAALTGPEAGEVFDLPPILSKVLATMLTHDNDLVLHRRAAFSAGMMMDPIHPEHGQKERHSMGTSLHAFGHPGAGGSLAFADPEHDVAFAYVMNQMELGVLPGEKPLGIVRALYSLPETH